MTDEPISNLDPASGRAVLDLFKEIQAAGTTVVLSAHDSAIAALATMVYELKTGKLIGAGKE